MSFRIANIVEESLVDGPGIRLAIFFQGCNKHCPGCFNPETWDYTAGTNKNDQDIFDLYDRNPLYDGISYLGGEPVDQWEHIWDLVEAFYSLGKNQILYTGYTVEELTEMVRNNYLNSTTQKSFLSFLTMFNYIKVGRYEEDKKSMDIKFRGSTNQRIVVCMGDMHKFEFVDVTEDWDLGNLH